MAVHEMEGPMPARRKREWFDNDAFWRETYSFMFPDTRIDAAKDEVDKIIKLTNIKKGAALDLCCGPGRCTVALAKRRFKVTGVDRTKFLLDKARARARAGKAKIEFIQKDMRDFIRPDTYDLVLSMFTSFGYFENKDEDLAVLRNIHASMCKGGALVMDTIPKERIARIFLPASVDEEPDGSLFVQRREAVDDWTRMRNEWIIIRKGRAKSFKFEHTVFSARELRDLFERAGFKRVKMYGSLDGAPFSRDSLRLIAVGWKG
jgi:SAM-dependent methyltransferase